MAQLAVLCCRACQREQLAAQCRAVPCHLLPYGGTSNFHFLPIHPVFGSDDNRESDGRTLISISSFHSFYRLNKTPRGPALVPAVCLPSSSAPPSPPGSRGGRPVSAGPIVKQRPKMCFPTSSPSLTSKHSDRPWKNAVRPQFFVYDDFHRCRAASSSAKI